MMAFTWGDGSGTGAGGTLETVDLRGVHDPILDIWSGVWIL